ncbi:glycosyltransferase family 2 protein [Aurantiacibacter sp. D1-12]|uniref:glycosyltransferase family 2 protein n=1 Tax=Aurantiacibacter sp. D1-12 TaxID=2993658 RepID=UPI00237D2277|nr:glycosyltransferase family 2 protein [Aurantiacibacter sp. D1-12]MDE1467460.1 glycosyltransferase family 2 protein [Aurantiacibacter sp. D1-12]
MTDRPDISILIVGFNSKRYLEALIASISPAAPHTPHEVLFVNNGCDGSERIVEELDPSIHILPSKGNVGFAAANNYLAGSARGQWLVLVNPDTELERGALDALMQSARSISSNTILGGVAVDANGEALRQAQIRFPSLATVAAGAFGWSPPALDLQQQAAIQVDAVSGGFLMIAREAWDRLGGMDASFFLYAEELDLCWRHRAAGGRVELVPASRFRHDVGSGDPHSPQRTLYSLRGIAHFYRKHHSVPYAWGLIALHWLSCATRLLAGGVASALGWKRHRLLRAFWRPALCPWLWMSGYSPKSAKAVI